MSEPKASPDQGDFRGKYRSHEPTPDNDELARFREAWRAEVKYRKQLAQGGSTSANRTKEEDKRPLQTPLRLSNDQVKNTYLPQSERTTVLATTRTNFTSTQVRRVILRSRQTIDSHHSKGVCD
jgi:hypothetical protein